MYLHLGQSVVVPYRDVIGLFDLDNTTSSHITRAALERAEREGRVVGYLHLETYDLLYADSMVNVLGIAVSRDCRRQGVGKALLSAGEAWAKSVGAAAVRLVSGETRKGAHAFYQSLGYTGNKLQRNFKKYL